MKSINMKGLFGKKILITGGFGFVGINLVTKLLSEGIEPTIIDYLPNGSSVDQNYVPFKLNDVKFINLDIRNRNEVIKKVKSVKPDYVIHLASMTDLTRDFNRAELSVDVNIKGTINLLESIHNQPITNFIFISSSDVYGDVKPPFRENQNVIPASPYSVSKISSELYCLMFSKVFDFPITILRGFNLFGKYQIPNRVIPFIITELLQDHDVQLTEGEQKREFNYVDNLIDAILLSLLNTKNHGEIINIGCGESFSIREIALSIGKSLNRVNQINLGAKPYRPNEIWDMYCDNSRAKTLLDWEPRISLDEGIQMTIKWFKTLHRKKQ